MVRKPGDHELVGRSVAQRRLRLLVPLGPPAAVGSSGAKRARRGGGKLGATPWAFDGFECTDGESEGEELSRSSVSELAWLRFWLAFEITLSRISMSNDTQ